MIRGVLLDPQNPGGEHHIAVSSMAIPIIVATIRIPRLKVSDRLPLLADSGADITSLHLRDAIRVLGMRKYLQLRGETTVGGVGGDAKYFLEPTRIIFVHEDGNIEGYNFELRIAKIPPGSPSKLKHALQLPSVLGRDILHHFRIVIDYSREEFYLDHS